MRRKGNRFKQLRDANKKRQDDAKAAREAEKAIQEVKPTAAPPDPPPAASSEAKPGSPSSLPHSIEENLVVSTPQLGSGSTGTASSAPGDAAQPKALVGCPNKIGRRKGESGRQTAAATEARVAQEARDFVLNAPVPPKEPKFLPDSSGMYGRPDANRLWPSADHNREQPKPRPHERRAAETLKQAEQAFEDQKTLAEWVAGKHANGALDMNSGTRVAYKQGLVAGQLLQLVLFVYQVTYFATIEFTGAVYKATHFAADVVHGREGYLYIENDQKKLRGWVSADGSQPTESEKKKGKRSADGTTAGYVLSYVLFPVLVAVERILIAFLEANGFLAVLAPTS